MEVTRCPFAIASHMSSLDVGALDVVLEASARMNARGGGSGSGRRQPNA